VALQDNDVAFDSLDGFALKGTISEPHAELRGNAVIVHGITVQRDEFGGFNVRLAERLAADGFRSLRFDLRGHGESDGAYEDLTLCGGISDIAAAIRHLRGVSDEGVIHLIGSSFGGGLAAMYAARYGETLRSLSLLNPNLDYHRSWLASDAYWNGEAVSPAGAQNLTERGWVSHGDFRVGRALLHELVHLAPAREMSSIKVPTLTLHGDADSVVPFDVAATNATTARDWKFIPVQGADHGFVTPDDEDGDSTESRNMQAAVFNSVCEWMRRAEEAAR